MKVLLVIAIFILIIWLCGKFYSWDNKKNDGFGCGMIAIIGTILMFVLGFIGMVKSCSDDIDNGPSYDYYDDARK